MGDAVIFLVQQRNKSGEWATVFVHRGSQHKGYATAVAAYCGPGVQIIRRAKPQHDLGPAVYYRVIYAPGREVRVVRACKARRVTLAVAVLHSCIFTGGDLGSSLRACWCPPCFTHGAAKPNRGLLTQIHRHNQTGARPQTDRQAGVR